MGPGSVIEDFLITDPDGKAYHTKTNANKVEAFLRNTFETHGLERNSVGAFFATTARYEERTIQKEPGCKRKVQQTYNLSTE